MAHAALDDTIARIVKEFRESGTAPGPRWGSSDGRCPVRMRKGSIRAMERRDFLALGSLSLAAQALSAAENQGLTQLLARESAADLLLLGNSARFASRSEPARRSYLSLRERFPGTASASLSAYYLARLAGDLDKNSGEAVRWLRVFLSESPRGDLAASARARLMDLLRKQGDALGARSVARQYLELHPTGPHTELARSILAAKSP